MHFSEFSQDHCQVFWSDSSHGTPKPFIRKPMKWAWNNQRLQQTHFWAKKEFWKCISFKGQFGAQWYHSHQLVWTSSPSNCMFSGFQIKGSLTVHSGLFILLMYLLVHYSSFNLVSSVFLIGARDTVLSSKSTTAYTDLRKVPPRMVCPRECLLDVIPK